MPSLAPTHWPSARHFAEAIQCPGLCFSNPRLRDTLPAVDRLGMPLVTSGQFAYVYKLKPPGGGAYAVRCFRGHLGDRERRYQLIDEHLRRRHIPALAGFAYEPQGILTGGRRFPILSMEWIEGPTLDVYLDEVMGRKDVLLHLADEWLRLMQLLREAEVAHGDLQHGNIIVERGALRLVDLDGMFVPAMNGWQACEMGHQHYQHPARNASFFDASLDNFSSLVVYLSLISLAERPELWAEHHDENLIFTKSDFVAPDASALFEKIKNIGPEQRRLAEALEILAQSQPSDALSVLELVSRKEKKLPSWMTTPTGIEIAARSREATPAEAAALGATTSQWASWQPKRANRTLPTSPSSSTVQSVFSGPASGQANAAAPTHYIPSDPSDIGNNALAYSKELAQKAAGLWWVALFACRWVPAAIFDVTEFAGAILLIIFAVAGVLIYGLVRAAIEARAAQRLNSSAGGAGALPPAANAANQLPFWLWNTPTTSAQSVPMPAGHAVQSTPPATAMKSRIVGSRVLAIYHLPTCEWALKISQQNCVGFRSAKAARAAGYHPCQVCMP